MILYLHPLFLEYKAIQEARVPILRNFNAATVATVETTPAKGPTPIKFNSTSLFASAKKTPTKNADTIVLLDEEDFNNKSIKTSTGCVEHMNPMETVFTWKDSSGITMVTCVFTLPSGVKGSDCQVNVVTEGNSGVSNVLEIRHPMLVSFLDPSIVLRNSYKNMLKTDISGMPEAIAFSEALKEKHANVNVHPSCVYRVVLPIPVQTMKNTITLKIFKTVPALDSNLIQVMLVIKMTGVLEKHDSKYVQMASDDDRVY